MNDLWPASFTDPDKVLTEEHSQSETYYTPASRDCTETRVTHGSDCKYDSYTHCAHTANERHQHIHTHWRTRSKQIDGDSEKSIHTWWSTCRRITPSFHPQGCWHRRASSTHNTMLSEAVTVAAVSRKKMSGVKLILKLKLWVKCIFNIHKGKYLFVCLFARFHFIWQAIKMKIQIYYPLAGRMKKMIWLPELIWAAVSLNHNQAHTFPMYVYCCVCYIFICIMRDYCVQTGWYFSL